MTLRLYQKKVKVTANGYRTLINDKSVIQEIIYTRGVIFLDAETAKLKPKLDMPSEIAVFWDASKKPRRRNVIAEIDYLKSYLATNEIAKMHLTIFNETLISEEFITISPSSLLEIEQKLKSVEYMGYSDFDFITIKKVDQVLVFTNNKPTLGNPFVDQEIKMQIINT